jgi:hypothetical protein
VVVDVMVQHGGETEWYQSDGKSVSRATLAEKVVPRKFFYNGVQQVHWSN